MRTPLLLGLLATLAGCLPNFETVDEACTDKIAGDQHVDDEAMVDAIARTNCYRRLVKLSRIGFDKTVQQMAEEHVDYLMQNEAWLDPTRAWSTETLGNPGFTGASIDDRLASLDYYDDLQSVGVWEYVWADNLDGPERVDFWFPDPFSRQVFLQPSVNGLGYAELSVPDEEWYRMAYLAMIYAVPANEAINRPIVYPRDGQTGVDYSFVPVDPQSPLFAYGEVGFPITVTVGAQDGIVFKTVALSGPSGNIDLIVHQPPDGGLRGTLSATPVVPLEPNSEYHFEATVTYSNDDWPLESTFHTGSQISRPGLTTTTTRTAPHRLVRHTILKAPTRE